MALANSLIIYKKIPTTKDSFMMVINMEKVIKVFKMGTHTQDSIVRINFKATDNTNGRTELFIKGPLWMVINMERDFYILLMAKYSKSTMIIINKLAFRTMMIKKPSKAAAYPHFLRVRVRKGHLYKKNQEISISIDKHQLQSGLNPNKKD